MNHCNQAVTNQLFYQIINGAYIRGVVALPILQRQVQGSLWAKLHAGPLLILKYSLAEPIDLLNLQTVGIPLASSINDCLLQKQPTCLLNQIGVNGQCRFYMYSKLVLWCSCLIDKK